MTEPLLRVQSLCKHFPVTKGVFGRVHGCVRAVDDVSFELGHGETLGLVGESGCGKSTVGRTLLRLQQPTSGRVWFNGRDLAELGPGDLQRTRRDMQIVFQDPYSSLNPRMRVFDIVGEALAVHGVARGEELRRRVFELLGQVGVSARWADRYAHEFSGGQRQRIGIARAIALKPKLLVCDEAVSALDVSIQAQIINLLIQLREQLGLSYLFISHDLSVVKHISHRVMVMYLGHVVELGPTRALFERAAHPYTRALLSAVPVADPRHRPERVVLVGDVPSPLNPPSGCRFHTRCPVAFERCSREAPELYTLGAEQRTVRCFHAEGLSAQPDWYDTLLGRFAEVERSKVGATAVGPRVTELESGDDTFSAAVPGSVGSAEAEKLLAEVFDGPQASGGLVGLGSDETTLTRGRRAVVALLFALALVAVWAQSSRVAKLGRARAEMRALGTELHGYRQVVGGYPAAVAELGYRLGFVFGRRPVTDPWGSPYVLEKVSTDEPTLRSLGADQTAGTLDDLVHDGF